MIAQLDFNFIKMRPSKLWARLIAYVFFEGRPLTTKGQWFNSVIRVWFGIIVRLPINKSLSNPVFIVGMGRSGTTALGSVLSIHKDFGYLNEPKALWNKVFPQDDVIGSYSVSPGQYRVLGSEVGRAEIIRANRLYTVFKKLVGAKIVLDKYPEILFRIEAIKKIYPNAKFIFISRNGYDNCKSVESWCFKHRKTVDGEIHDWWGLNNRKWECLKKQLVPEHQDLNTFLSHIDHFHRDIDKAAVEWILTMREGLRAVDQHPNDVLHVKYEDFCDQPRAVLNEIYEFTGAAVDDFVACDYGSLTLKRQNKPVGQLPIDSSLSIAFHETMKSLNYA